MRLFVAIAHMAQNVFLTPINSNFFGMAPEDYDNSTLSVVGVFMILFRPTSIPYHCYTGYFLVKAVHSYCMPFLLRGHFLH